jgi:hypothetical protein
MKVMINQLGPDESHDVFMKIKDHKITEISLVTEKYDDELRMTFDNGIKVKLYDDGQSCCESRYMKTDDDLPYFIGATLVDIEELPSTATDEDYDVHEIMFVHVKTDKGNIVLNTHNKHNGYYGGFYMRLKEI